MVQGFVLYTAMKKAGSKGMSKAEIAKVLDVSENSIGVYIFVLRKTHGAVFNTVKNGRSVERYILANPEEVNIEKDGKPRGRKKHVVKSVKTAATKTVANKNAKSTKNKIKATKSVSNKSEEKAVAFDRDLDIVEITDNDMADIRSSLGLNSFDSFSTYME